MTVAAVPDCEKIAADFLREHDAVEALGARVVGKTPSSVAVAWVRLTQINAPSDPTSTADHLVAFYLQLDCYAGATGGQPEANLLGRTIRAALQEMPAADLDDAVCSRVRINGDSRIPDTQLEPARERRILTATVWLHAT